MSASVSDIELHGPGGGARRGNKIEAKELSATFTVTVDTDGCYAIFVSLWEDDDNLLWFLNPDEKIAWDTRNAIECHCLTAGEAQEFEIGATASEDPAEPPAPDPDSSVIPLAPMKGNWPKSDAGGEIELRLEVEVKLCTPNCGKECDDYSYFTDSFGDPVGKGSSELVDIPLPGGKEPHEIMKEAVKAAAPSVIGELMKSTRSEEATEAVSADLAWREGVSKQLRALQRSVRATEERMISERARVKRARSERRRRRPRERS